MWKLLEKILPPLSSTENYVLIRNMLNKYNRKVEGYSSFKLIPEIITAVNKFETKHTHEIGYVPYISFVTHSNNLSFKDDKLLRVDYKIDSIQQIQILICEIPINISGYETIDVATHAIAKSMELLGIDEYTLIYTGTSLQLLVSLSISLDFPKWLLLSAKWKNALNITNLKIIDDVCLNPLGKIALPNTYNRHKSIPGIMTQCTKLANNSYDVEYLEDCFAIFNKNPAESTVIDFDLITFNEYLHDEKKHTIEFEDLASKCIQLNSLNTIETPSDNILSAAFGIVSFCSNSSNKIFEVFPTANHSWLQLKSNQLTHMGTVNSTTCRMFDEAIPNKCNKCKYNGKLNTPLKLSLGAHSISETPLSEMPKLPKGYVIKNNKLYRIIASTGEEIKVFDYIGYLEDIGMEIHAVNPITYFQFMFKIPHYGWIPLRFEAHMIHNKSGKDSVIEKCANAGIFMNETEVKLVKDYLLACAKERQQENRHPAKIISQFGWDNDETNFNLGQLSISSLLDNKTIPRDDAVSQLAKAYSQKGEIEKWKQVTDYLAYDSMKYHAFGLFLGFGAPLTKFAGLSGALVNFYSENAGTGKSSTGTIANSIYGNPKELGFTAEDTEISTFIKMGIINNLPIYIDEISEWDGHKISNFLYFSSGGKEKSRATQDASLKSVRSWNTIVITSSNKSVLDKLQMHTMSSEGQESRFLEICMERTEHVDIYGKLVNTHLNNHYGVAGSIYIKELVRMSTSGKLQKDILNARELYEKTFKFNFLGEERFIANTICCAWVGAIYAQKLDLISDKIDISNVFAHINLTVLNKRRKKQEERTTSLEIINLFILDNQNKFVKIKRFDNSSEVIGSCPDDAIHGRIELHYKYRDNNTPYNGVVMIAYDAFKIYCREKRHSFNAIMDSIERDRLNYRTANLMLTSGINKTIKGTDAPRVTVKSFCIDLPSSWLESYNIIEKGD